MNNITILQGKVVKQDGEDIIGIYVYVELYHVEPKQTIKALVIAPIFVNAEEQEVNIKVGTEVILLGWGVDGFNNFIVLGSTSNGIDIPNDSLGKTKIENINSIEIIAPNVFISNNNKERDEVNSEKKQGDVFETWFKKSTIKTDKMSITNGNDDLVSLTSSLMTQVATLAGNVSALETIVIGSTPSAPIVSSVSSLKTKQDSFT